MSEVRPQTFAMLQTPGGAGGIAVVLLAGEGAAGILDAAFRRTIVNPAGPRRCGPCRRPAGDRLALGELHDLQGRLDEAVVTVRPMPGPVGGIVAEINIHGGPRVTQRVLQFLADAGATIVPDEAELASRLGVWPLSAVDMDNPGIGRELLAALPQASTRLGVSMLARQWSAGVSKLACGALSGLPAGKGGDLRALGRELDAAADRLELMKRLLKAAEIVLAGPPNAGKSSLTNALVGRDVCIVTETPGTTRDWVRELADVGGFPAWLTDTAGLWAPADPLDAEAVRRAWEKIDAADLVLAVFDAASPPPASDTNWRRLMGEPNVLLVANKADLPAEGTTCCQHVSAVTRAGLKELQKAILARLGGAEFDPDRPAAFTLRQAEHLHAAAEALNAGAVDKAVDSLVALVGGGRHLPIGPSLEHDRHCPAADE